MQLIIKTLNIKKLFLIDFLGAVLSAFLLGVVLVKYEDRIGLPTEILYLLAAIAVIFAIYSFICYLTFKDNGKPFLTAIAIANLLYCCFTICLMIYLREHISQLGLIYFLLEVSIILILVKFEFATAQKH